MDNKRATLFFLQAVFIYSRFVVEILVVFCVFALVRRFNAQDAVNTEKETQLRRDKPSSAARPGKNLARGFLRTTRSCVERARRTVSTCILIVFIQNRICV